MRALVVAGAAALLLAGCTSGGDHPSPSPTPNTYVPLNDNIGVNRLHGMPLPGRLNVRIVDGNKLINLDPHHTQKIAGLPAQPNSATGLAVLSGGGGLFVLSAHGTKARRIAGNVSSATPGKSGIWFTRGTRKCTLREVSVGGRTIVPARPINCGYRILDDTQRGLIAGTNTDSVLLDNRLRTTVRATYIAVAGKTLITTDGTQFRVGNRTTRLPQSIGDPDSLFASPDNRYVAVEFDNPACPGPRQCLDTWVLKLATMRWIHPPSMPVSIYLKPHNLYWGPGDRFSWLGTFDGVGGAVATWQPGATALRVRQISLPNSQYGVLHG